MSEQSSALENYERGQSKSLELEIKQDYFILGLAWAAIGFIIIQTKDTNWDCLISLIIFSVICLGLSIFFGYRSQDSLTSLIRVDMNQSLVARKIERATKNGEKIDEGEFKAETSKNLKKCYEYEKSYSFSRRMVFVFFLLGGGLFFVWHLIQIYLHSKGV